MGFIQQENRKTETIACFDKIATVSLDDFSICFAYLLVMSKKIIIKTADQIDKIRHAGKILNELLLLTAHAAKP